VGGERVIPRKFLSMRTPVTWQHSRETLRYETDLTDYGSDRCEIVNAIFYRGIEWKLRPSDLSQLSPLPRSQ
jgi:hypothetical protein